MIKLITFLLSSTGFTLIVTQSTLFKPMREWLEIKHKKDSPNNLIYWWAYSITKCSLCFGLYSGMFCYILIYKEFSIDILAYGFIGSLAAYFAVSYIDKIKRY